MSIVEIASGFVVFGNDLNPRTADLGVSDRQSRLHVYQRGKHGELFVVKSDFPSPSARRDYDPVASLVSSAFSFSDRDAVMRENLEELLCRVKLKYDPESRWYVVQVVPGVYEVVEEDEAWPSAGLLVGRLRKI